MASRPQTGNRPPFRPRDRSKTRTPGGSYSTSSSHPIDDVLSSLECPVCFETLQAPIFICTLGHNLCGDCKNKMPTQKCPMCNTNMTGQRNFTLEEIAEKCAAKCPNTEYGCSYKSSKDKIAIHVQNCSYQPYSCPFGEIHNSCPWKGKYSDIITHFSSVHPNNNLLKSGVEIKFTDFNVYKKDHDLQLIILGKNMCFLYHVDINPSKGVANWAIQKIGSEKKAFDYEFTFYHNKKFIKIVEECKPSSIPLKSLFESGNCVSIPLNVLNTFVNPRRELAFKMFIRSRNEIHPEMNLVNNKFKKLNH